MGKGNNKPADVQGSNAAKDQTVNPESTQETSEEKTVLDESNKADSIPDISLEEKQDSELPEKDQSEEKTEDPLETLDVPSVSAEVIQVPIKGEYAIEVIVGTKNLKEGSTYKVSGTIANELLKKGLIKLL